MVNKAAWIFAVIIAMIIAAVALAYAGWDTAAIVGLMAGISALAAPLLALIVKSDNLADETRNVHDIVNSQRSKDTAYRQKLSEELRIRGIHVPLDAEGNED